MQWVEFPYSVNLKAPLHHLFGLSWEMQTWERWSMQLRLWESWKKDHLLLLWPSQQATLTLFCSLRLWLRNMEIWLSDLLFLGVQLSTSQWKRPSRFFKESLLWSGMSWWSWTLSISQPSFQKTQILLQPYLRVSDDDKIIRRLHKAFVTLWFSNLGQIRQISWSRWWQLSFNWSTEKKPQSQRMSLK